MEDKLPKFKISFETRKVQGNIPVSKYRKKNKQLTEQERNWLLMRLKSGLNVKKARYDKEENLFYLTQKELFAEEEVVSDQEMKTLYEELEKEKLNKSIDLYKTMLKEGEKEARKQQLTEEYGKAVTYFRNDAFINEKGIYLQSNSFTRKKYLTPFELDTFKEKYENIMKAKK